jgi:hypothetical protein
VLDLNWILITTNHPITIAKQVGFDSKFDFATEGNGILKTLN